MMNTHLSYISNKVTLTLNLFKKIWTKTSNKKLS